MIKEKLNLGKVVYGVEKNTSFIGKVKELLQDGCTIHPIAITAQGLKRWWNLKEPLHQSYNTIIGPVEIEEMFDEYHDTVTKTPIELSLFIELASKELANNVD